MVSFQKERKGLQASESHRYCAYLRFLDWQETEVENTSDS